MEQVHREYKGRGLEVVAVNLQEPKDRVEAWVKKNKVTIRVVLDPESTASRAYRISVTPTVFIVGRDGKLVGAVLGAREWTSPRGRALLEALLGP